MMYDGSEPPELVSVGPVCSGNSVKAQGYTDSKGHFSFNLEPNNRIYSDTSDFPDRGLLPLANTPSDFGATGATSSTYQASQYWDCELRASLPGYRSDTVSLAGMRGLDNPNVGVILLYPIAGIQGLTASATSGQAPKNARNAYEKGLNAVKKNMPDEAEQSFRKAVQAYPKYAEAWYELGKALERRDHYPEAREAYSSALAADSKYVYPISNSTNSPCAIRTGRSWWARPISCCIWIHTSFRQPTTSTPWGILS